MTNPLQIKRIMSESKDLLKNPSDMFFAQPLEENMFTWHFTIKGPVDTPY
jgi:ubiquitin-conjugating enzyme E2 J1